MLRHLIPSLFSFWVGILVGLLVSDVSWPFSLVVIGLGAILFYLLFPWHWFED